VVPIDYACLHAAAPNERKRLALGAHDAVGIYVNAVDVKCVIETIGMMRVTMGLEERSVIVHRVSHP
jgi:hypothetical protein